MVVMARGLRVRKCGVLLAEGEQEVSRSEGMANMVFCLVLGHLGFLDKDYKGLLDGFKGLTKWDV